MKKKQPPSALKNKAQANIPLSSQIPHAATAQTAKPVEKKKTNVRFMDMDSGDDDDDSDAEVKKQKPEPQKKAPEPAPRESVASSRASENIRETEIVQPPPVKVE